MKKKKYISPTTYVHHLVVKHHVLNYSVKELKSGGTTTVGVGDDVDEN